METPKGSQKDTFAFIAEFCARFWEWREKQRNAAPSAPEERLPACSRPFPGRIISAHSRPLPANHQTDSAPHRVHETITTATRRVQLMFSFAYPCASISHRVDCTSSLKPLEHRRVLVTAPIQYATRILPRLIEKHARPIHAPLISTKPLSERLSFDLEDAILRLSEYDIVAFTSRTGIKCFAEKVRNLCETDEQASLMLRASGVRLAALGADGGAVREYLHVAPDILPPDPSPFGLVDFLARDPELKGSRILCPIPKVVNLPEPPVVPTFLRDLEEAGFEVKSVAAYVTSPLERLQVEVEVQLLHDGHIDAVLIASQGEAYALHRMLSETERSTLVEQVNRGQLLFAAHGPYTASGITEVFGVQDIVLSENWASFQGVVDALEKRFADISAGDGLILPV